MFLKPLDLASHRCVASELVNKLFNEIIIEEIEIIFSALDTKKWRIAHTFAVCKKDGL